MRCGKRSRNVNRPNAAQGLAVAREAAGNLLGGWYPADLPKTMVPCVGPTSLDNQ